MPQWEVKNPYLGSEIEYQNRIKLVMNFGHPEKLFRQYRAWDSTDGKEDESLKKP